MVWDLIRFMKSGEKEKVEILRFASSFIKQEENLLKLYPYNLSSFFHREKPKIIFIGDFTNYNYSIVDEIWLKEKDNIFKNFQK